MPLHHALNSRRTHPLKKNIYIHLIFLLKKRLDFYLMTLKDLKQLKQILNSISQSTRHDITEEISQAARRPITKIFIPSIIRQRITFQDQVD